ncbi:P-loop containing nucleoside triphosphate hydrolase protein [Rhizoclosmatium globosum]|uniref:p-loop containing nucleoside triphosphate hydrolase protein n=1 Tax=Rhizoclosmatium globosum TaxID=329046 RepID=A0A1Y2BK56_9FUNG|nr:P-loop containing nucleoside triphosphate hydrolase protein [Rhizoclosmatium globosum]|eukprot:ORY35158.1 P-loop containing nucleoside triphosphate hydrolase protein [Rhizoclosmatium globosum]
MQTDKRFRRRQSVSFPSRWLFFYINEAIARGRKKTLGSEDWAYLDDSDDSTKLADEILTVLVGNLLEEGLMLVSAYILSLLLLWFKQDSSERDFSQGIGYALILSVVGVVTAIIRHGSRWINTKLGMVLRVSFIAAIYRKCMNLSISHTSSTGFIVNLIANDLNRFEEASVVFLFIGIGPLILIIVTVLLYHQIGNAAFVASGATLLMIPLQGFISKLFGKYRRASVAPRDSRLKSLSDMLTGIMMVKLYAWEEPLINNIDNLRKEEVSMMKKAYFLRAINLSFFQAFSCIIELFAFVSFYLMGGVLTPSNVFTSIALLQSLRWNMGLRFPYALQFTTESLVSFKRIQTFFLLPEIEPAVSNVIPDGADESTLILLDKCSFKWSNKYILENINLHLKTGSLLSIIGPVGAGKSSLLNGILREMDHTGGFYTRNGLNISYAGQSPWIITGSIQDNIVFGEALDVERLNQVIKACSLERDLKSFEHGLNTIVGERGITLSGGQKARVALARACYSTAELVLLDDPLAAVDAKVGRQIFDNCIMGFLAGRARILVTHQLQKQWRKRSETVIDESVEVEDDTIVNGETKEDVAAPAVFTKEEAAKGSVSLSVYRDYFRAGSSWFMLIVLSILCVAGQAMLIVTDWWVGQWSSQSASGQQESKWWILFLILTLVTLTSVGTRTLMFFIVCIESSLKLSEKLVRSVFGAEMQFFVENPVGRILNRLSSDLNRMDESLPWTFFDFVNAALSSIATLILAIYYMPVVLVSVPFISLAFWYLRTMFVQTSRLSTVRAFGAQARFVENWVLYLGLGRWLGMRLDLVAAVFNAFVTLCAVGFTRVDSLALGSSSVGLVLTYSLNLVGVVQWAFRQSAETENLMTSVERVPCPNATNEVIPETSWPQKGEINVVDLKMRYPGNEKLVLKGLNIRIPAGSTVGIVGRTGSGKSSLLQALFRLVIPTGTITIDGSSFSIVPQDPFLFRGSLQLWSAISDVQLREMVEQLPGKLDAFISENGGNLSVGERQLLKLFVMDEATSAVDLNTDALIAKVLRYKGGAFSGVTTLTIAHRLNTIIDYDYVLVLNDGNVVEYGAPAELLKKVSETGDEGRQLLVAQAEAAYLAKKAIAK